jgi:hypothetical protein
LPFDPPTKFAVKDDLRATLGLAVEDRSGRHLDGEHLFQAKRQRAELDTVGLAACLVAAALVFDGKRTPTAPASGERNAWLASTTGQEFNDVGCSERPSR